MLTSEGEGGPLVAADCGQDLWEPGAVNKLGRSTLWPFRTAIRALVSSDAQHGKYANSV
jgi:hypothetical protein